MLFEFHDVVIRDRPAAAFPTADGPLGFGDFLLVSGAERFAERHPVELGIEPDVRSFRQQTHGEVARIKPVHILAVNRDATEQTAHVDQCPRPFAAGYIDPHGIGHRTFVVGHDPRRRWLHLHRAFEHGLIAQVEIQLVHIDRTGLVPGVILDVDGAGHRRGREVGVLGRRSEPRQHEQHDCD